MISLLMYHILFSLVGDIPDDYLVFLMSFFLKKMCLVEELHMFIAKLDGGAAQLLSYVTWSVLH